MTTPPTGAAMTAEFCLDGDDLHRSLADPALGSIAYLNEVMLRYPDAISFAPGAPHADFFTDIDIGDCVDAYLDHVARSRDLSPAQARLLLFEYGPSRGLINDLVAGSLRTDLGIDVPVESIVITVGAQEAMLLALRTLCQPSRDLLAVVSPCFVGLTGAARLLDVGVVPIAEVPEGIDLDRLESACREARASGNRIRALYVAADFSNPAGTLLDLDSRLVLLDAAERHDFLVLEDHTYGFTAPEASALPTLKALDRRGRVIHIGTFAKVCAPGLRVGYLVADQRVRRPGRPEALLADDISALKGMTTVNTSPICQAIVGGMLVRGGGSMSALTAPRSERYRRNLATLLDALDRLVDLPRGVTWNRPTGGFFVRVAVPCRVDAALVETSAAHFGVLWTPMSPFHVGGGEHNEIRLSCSYLDPPDIVDGVGRLGGFLRDLG